MGFLLVFWRRIRCHPVRGAIIVFKIPRRSNDFVFVSEAGDKRVTMSIPLLSGAKLFIFVFFI